ncbi:MAG: hypothetical protein LBU39_03620 [Desulfobulbaceae bacterium]|nr:hypothetical protein [Desulfobulbaceae bacterium]
MTQKKLRANTYRWNGRQMTVRQLAEASGQSWDLIRARLRRFKITNGGDIPERLMDPARLPAKKGIPDLLPPCRGKAGMEAGGRKNQPEANWGGLSGKDRSMSLVKMTHLGTWERQQLRP